MTTLLETEQEINWDELTPPCESNLCDKNPGELAAVHRHFDPTDCKIEGAIYWICRPCYDQIRELPTACINCLEGASLYEL